MLPVQVLQKQDHHTSKCTLPVLLQNTVHNTGKVSFSMTLSVSIYIITGREIVGDDHTGIDFERLDDSTSTVIFWIAIPVLMTYVVMTVLVQSFFLITIPVLTSLVAMTVPVL
jgi:hypothetical protein